jgi:hypothetical protein
LLALRQHCQVLRVAQQDLGQELAAGKDRDQDFQRAWVLDQLPEGLACPAHSGEALHVDQRLVGVGAGGQRGQQVRQQAVESLAVLRGHLSQVTRGGRRVGKAKRREQRLRGIIRQGAIQQFWAE